MTGRVALRPKPDSASITRKRNLYKQVQLRDWLVGLCGCSILKSPSRGWGLLGRELSLCLQGDLLGNSHKNGVTPTYREALGNWQSLLDTWFFFMNRIPWGDIPICCDHIISMIMVIWRDSSRWEFAVIHLLFKEEIAVYASLEQIWICHEKAIFFGMIPLS